jgi:hypothetical protein
MRCYQGACVFARVISAVGVRRDTYTCRFQEPCLPLLLAAGALYTSSTVFTRASLRLSRLSTPRDSPQRQGPGPSVDADRLLSRLDFDQISGIPGQSCW